METESNIRVVTIAQRVTIQSCIEENRKKYLEQKEKFYWSTSDFWVIDQDTLNVYKDPSMKSNRKSDDFYAAIAVDALVVSGGNGDDAVILRGDTIEFVELKLSVKTKPECWLFEPTDDEILNTTNPRFTIYIGEKKSSNPASLKASVGGSYEIAQNLNKKNRTTFFVLLEDYTFDIIDVRQLTGDKVLDLLSKSEARKRFISYKQFLDHGSSVETVLPQIGYEGWTREIVQDTKNYFYERRAALLEGLSPSERKRREKLDRKNLYSIKYRTKGRQSS